MSIYKWVNEFEFYFTNMAPILKSLNLQKIINKYVFLVIQMYNYI